MNPDLRVEWVLNSLNEGSRKTMRTLPWIISMNMDEGIYNRLVASSLHQIVPVERNKELIKIN